VAQDLDQREGQTGEEAGRTFLYMLIALTFGHKNVLKDGGTADTVRKYLHLGKKVRVRADHTSVKTYVGTEMVKMHPRVLPGKRATDTKDYPVGQGVTATRDVASLLASARKSGEHIGRYAERLLDVPLPWTRMRRVYALLRLCRKYGDGRVEAICQSALAFDVVDVKRITHMLEAAQPPTQPSTGERKVVPLTPPRFARSAEHFATRPSATKGDSK